MGLATLITAAAEEHSKTPFFIVGIILVVFAVLTSVVGFTRPQWPGSDGAARGIMGLGVVLVVVTAAMVIFINR